MSLRGSSSNKRCFKGWPGDSDHRLVGAALEVSARCRRFGFRFCFIGGIAVQRCGNPRFTADVNLTLIAGYGRDETFVDALLTELSPRRPAARGFAIQHRVLLARTRAGIDVDVALGALPFEERSVERASAWRLDDAGAIATCSAEDLVVYKAFAGRDRDWETCEECSPGNTAVSIGASFPASCRHSWS